MKRDIQTSSIEVVDDALAEIFKQKSPAERIAIVADANRAARVLTAAGARYLHPDWDESQIQAKVARRVSGFKFTLDIDGNQGSSSSPQTQLPGEP